MKKFSSAISLLLIIGLVYYSFYALMPQKHTDATVASTQFSTERALTHVKEMSKKPHYVGSKAHAEVRQYLIAELEKLGLEATTQEGYTTGGGWGSITKAINVIAKVKGTENSKALLLLSHYDSREHSSYGASDAASGVATILEGVRAFLSTNKTPKNDIIIVFTDAEELGLNGADLFVNKHPWAKDIGLALNFEARGSGGPSYMLIETNGGNKKLIEHFAAANPQFPVANSLAYSIYKMLPNDTDLTVFREDGNINGFNFAFIDDHYDYHSALDNYARLDKNTLEHQGTYLMPLLHYFSNADLSSLNSNTDDVYFNVPGFKLVHYPFSWIIPMLIIAFLLFIGILAYGFKNKTLKSKDIGKGFLPFIISLVINGVVGYFAWQILTWLYPEYKDILHGFTYNGHLYIAAFIAFSIAVCFYSYAKFRKVNTPNLLVAPLLFWLLICAGVAIYLKGASFFIIPAFGALVSFLVVINQKKPSTALLVVLAIPALWILSPFLQMFPVGLGLKMIVAATVLVTLLFGLLVAVFGFYKRKKSLAYLSFLIAIGLFIKAHFNSNFNTERPKPNSLLYVLDNDTNKAQWATYDAVIDDWTGQFVNTTEDVSNLNKNTISSKYNTSFSKTASAPIKQIETPLISIAKDTIIGNNRRLSICISPQRDVNRLEIFLNSDTKLISCSVNNLPLKENYLDNLSKGGRLLTHHISNNDDTELVLEFNKDEALSLRLLEASFNLLEHPKFSIPKRPKNTIPMPFVLNDAVVTLKTINF
jgi:hypothetical protein